jgi:hypothetical protein
LLGARANLTANSTKKSDQSTQPSTSSLDCQGSLISRLNWIIARRTSRIEARARGRSI